MIKQKQEFIFVVYIFLFALIRPIVLTASNSTLVLACATFFILVYSVFSNHFCITGNNRKIFWSLCGGIFFLVLIDMLFRNNGMQTIELYNFLIYGVIPLYLLRNVKDYNPVLKYYSIIAIITGLLFAGDPFIGYPMSGDYMSFGLVGILPAFCGAILQTFYFKHKAMWLFIALFFLELLIFANKSASLCAIVVFCAAYVFFSPSAKNRWKKTILIIISLLLLWALRELILDEMVKVASKMGYTTYALTTFKMMLTGKQEVVLSSRLVIWERVIDEIKDSLFLGKGIGYLESTSIGYAHNVFLDIIASFGIVGGAFFVWQLVRSIMKIVRFQNHDRAVFAVVILISWLIPMMFSLSFWKAMNFWIYWGVCFYGDRASRNLTMSCRDERK